MVGMHTEEGLIYVGDQTHSEAIALGCSLASERKLCVCGRSVLEHWHCPSQIGLRGPDGSRLAQVRGLALAQLR